LPMASSLTAAAMTGTGTVIKLGEYDTVGVGKLRPVGPTPIRMAHRTPRGQRQTVCRALAAVRDGVPRYLLDLGLVSAAR
jgi:hypothetical protein